MQNTSTRANQATNVPQLTQQQHNNSITEADDNFWETFFSSY